MGRGKIVIKRIENSTNRQLTYAKRRSGIIKKATEISVLCEAKVSLIIFSNNGKMHAYHSSNSSVEEILELYHKASGERLWDEKHEAAILEEKYFISKEHLKGEDITSLAYPELMRLENAVENGLDCVREKQMEIYDMYKKNHKMLEEEHEQLSYMVQNLVLEQMEGDIREMEGGNNYHFQQQPNPYGFRVQPMQPNLQDRV